MAEVFLAVSVGPEGFQHTVVIKRILPNLLEDPAFVRMFIDEAKLCGVMSHPNLVQIFEFGKVSDSFFIAMEHVHGRTLSAVQNRLTRMESRAPIATSLEIVRQVCVGLDYAHALRSSAGQPLGIVHRDVSPSNLMLSFHGGVKILDFGVARVAEELREAHTQVGTMKGKVSYMSPEQARLEPVDNRSDIFSVGIVLHELLTGRRLFRGTKEHSGARLVLEAPVPTPSSVNPKVPPSVDGLVMRALERDPDARFQTAGEMAGEIGELLLQMRASPQGPEMLLESLFPSEPSLSGEVQLTVPLSPRPMSDLGSGPSRSPTTRSSVPVTLPPAPDGDASAGVEAAQTSPDGPWARELAGLPVRWIAAGAASLAALAGAAIALHLAFSSAPAPPARVVAVRPPRPAPAPPLVTPVQAVVQPVVQLSLDSTPQDAQVTREGTGEVVGRTPLTLTLPRGNLAVTFHFEKSGHEPTDYKVIPDLDKTVRVELLTLRALAPPRALPLRRGPPAAHAVAVRPARPRGAAAPGTTPGLVQPGECTMSVGSFPWAELWIDDRDTGQRTPVVHYAVPCGAHKLALRRRDLKLDRSVPVTVSPGHELKQHYELDSEYGE